MNKIIKIVFQDGSEKELKNIFPLIISKDVTEQWKNNCTYTKQFKKFEEAILEYLDQDTVETYSKDSFDLIEEIEVDDETTIKDFDDSELIDEAIGRGLIPSGHSIVSEQFLIRFSKIIEKENQILLDTILNEFEKKLNI